MNSRTISHRLLGGAAAAALAAAGLTMIPQAAHAAAPGTTTADLTIRSGTTTGSSALGQIPADTTVDLECQTEGETVQGTYTSEFWAKVSYDGAEGYVSRAYVTVPDASGLGACDDAEEPDPGISEDRQEVLDRGQTWVDRGVPYSMEDYTHGPDGRQYRTDCSGFVSMAYGLDTSYSTVTLPEHFTEISKGDLQPGDIIGNLGPGSGGAAGHVVIFTGWTDDSQTTFGVIEQAGGVGAVARTHTWGDAFWSNNAYRYDGF
ncbi:SH3 domain-containing protein [Brachybacterium sp. AOP43-C2-M15]|uniref:SH3 domain-containing protein n=1 Tax=Brachybacterium sp. AOP43-C2-M15 TaxID=3457661 RepID=UPI004034C590